VTDQEQALLKLLPQKWQEVIIDLEARTWLNARDIAIKTRQSFLDAGGHMSLRSDAIDPNELPEPLRTCVYLKLQNGQ